MNSTNAPIYMNYKPINIITFYKETLNHQAGTIRRKYSKTIKKQR